MIVFRSAFRPRMKPAVKDPFDGALRSALGRAKARRVPVTLPRIGEAPAPGIDDPPAAQPKNGGAA